MRTLHQFHGGIHPPSHKAQSTRAPIATAPMPSKLVIPFRQHAGEAAKPVVQAGERVLKGQLIGKPEGFVSSAVHAPTSGTIVSIDMQPVAHPSGLPDMCATLLPDGRDEWVARQPLEYRDCSAVELRQLLRMSGIVGLGGAVFPSDIKLRLSRQKIRTLILNAAECEPYITCDDMLMRERAAEIVQGAEMLRFMLEAKEVLIGIEDNKSEAIAMMQQAVTAAGLPLEVIRIPTLYPGGSAKQLIRTLTGLEVPSGKLPTDIGVQCFNVGTTYAAWRAIAHGEPLISRVVTVTGNVRRPQNYEALLGTPIEELVALSEALPDTDRHIMGGPMMGFALPSLSVPLVKASNCIIAGSPALFPPPPPPLSCIRCTRCAQVCPADLQPQDLYWFAQSREFGKAQAFSLFDCIECGACSYVCPSHIPLVQYFRFAKSEIRAREQDKLAADKARQRHEFREFRIEQEKREKAEKLAAREKAALAAKAASAAPATVPAPDDAHAKIQQAVERARLQAAAVVPKNTENLTPAQQTEIAEIEISRARLREQAKSEVEHSKE
ncbi:MAG: electron transport complex subunit RsxC [Nitrosomonadales bacterium]|nr:electron transport complex subunit RsxC [Nitrosomonadales bacterium]